jgi:hypothetical protein
MAITFVGDTGTSSQSIKGDSGTLKLPSGMQEDDICFITAHEDTMNLVTLDTGWTTIYTSPDNSPGTRVAYKFMGATPDDHAHILGNKLFDYCAINFAFRGVDTTTPIDTGPAETTAATGDPDPGSLTTLTEGAARFVIGGQDDEEVAISPPSGWTLMLSEFSGSSAAVAYLLDTGGPNTIDPGVMSSSGSDDVRALHYALKPAAGGDPPAATYNPVFFHHRHHNRAA